MKTNKLIEKTKGFYKRSFTLIELIVVIVVIGILSAIVIPNISSFKDEAKGTAMISDVKNLQTAVDMYQLENHGDYPVLVEEGDAPEPTLGDPKAIDFDALFPDYVRDLPQHQGMHYWVDYQGQVYQSLVDNPDDFEKGDAGLTWTADENASGYEVYEAESKSTGSSQNVSLKKVKAVFEGDFPFTPENYSKDKTYLISAIDSYGNQAAHAIHTYKGIEPLVPPATPLTPEQEALVQDPTNKIVAAGYHHTLVVDKDGSLWSFGLNNYGQLGHSTNSGTNNPNPTPVKIMTNVKAVATGSYHSLVLKENGDLFSFGRNDYGQLGHPNYNGYPTPTLIMTNVKSVTAHGFHSLVIKENGDLFSFGHNQFGQLGHSTNSGSSNRNSTPTLIMTNVKSVATGFYHTLVIKENGDLVGFGHNLYGQLGHATNNNTSNPNPSHTLIMTNVKSVATGIYHSLVIKENGDLFSFGYNQYGELGHAANNNTGNPNPSHMLIMTNAKSVATFGHYSLVINKNGDLVGFGLNQYGQLGHSINSGTTNPNPTPTQIMTGVNVKSVATGLHHTLVTKENGELVSFGYNRYGQLGHSTNSGNSNPNPTPTQVILSTE